jgi:hypothetical protein
LPDEERPSTPEESAFRLQPNDAVFPDSLSSLLDGAPPGLPLLDGAPPEGFAVLLAQAKQAFQENRRRDCLGKTRVILSFDPGNKEAQVIEQCVRADLQKEVDDVRENVLKSGSRTGAEALQRAEQILLTILLTDPQYEPARLLIQEVRAAANSLAAVPKSRIDAPRQSSKSRWFLLQARRIPVIWWKVRIGGVFTPRFSWRWYCRSAPLRCGSTSLPRPVHRRP